MTERQAVSAGLLVVRESDGAALLVRRADGQTRPGHWAPPGGGLEGDETPLEAALREAGEELGPLPRLDVVGDEGHWTARGPFFAFGTFLALLAPEDEAWTPALNPENDAWGWFPPSELPEPLLPGVAAAVRDLSGRAGRRRPPHMGIEAAPRTYGACKVVNLDAGSPFFLTMGFTVVDDATGKAAVVTVPFHDRVPQMLWAPACRRERLKDARARYERVIEVNRSLRLFCAEGLEWEGALAFAVEDARASGAAAAGDLESALSETLGACLGR